ncbi:MAG TPA: DNA polymerase/3'-5' exonuclease PolX [Nitriliruptorales bacterium]|nr:DNA polymerase/3'-5' exonuclease PolX [Nitriliruptorales bacterium]
MPHNVEIARLLHELAILTELEEGSRQSFRARAYHNAVRAVEGEPRDVTSLTEAELTAIKGVGRAIAGKIREFAATGRIERLEQLRQRFPPGYLELVRLPGVGPKTVALLYERLGIASIDGLKAAVRAGRLRDLPGLGERTEQNIAAAIADLGVHGKDRRTPIADALPVAEEIVASLARVPGVERVEYAGSLRRFRETVADLDVVAGARDAAPVMEAFTHMAMVREVIARGPTKSAVVTARGLQVDLRVVAPGQFGAALQYFTGSQAHNIRVRERAVKRGLTLNEYGLFELEETDGEPRPGRLLASATEPEIYAALDLQWIPPGMREDVGEVEAAAAGQLPRLAGIADVVGDLHVHTDLSGDGRNSLDEMLDAALQRGLRYVAITDHAENLRINGVSREDMLAQRDRIATLNRQLHGRLTVLHGSELNIGLDGDLDYDDDFLLGFDWTVASVHSHFRLDRVTQTRRVIAAMQHPAVSCIGHLQGRRIGKRPGIELDVDTVLTAAEQTGTAIEINSNLDRLDASAEVLRAARGRDVVFVINTDTHRTHEFDYVRHGVRLAERGWVPAERIANTWEPERFLAWAGAKRARQR